MEVNSRSNWLVSIDPTTVGVQGGMIRPAINPSKSVSLKTRERSGEGGRRRGGRYDVSDCFRMKTVWDEKQVQTAVLEPTLSLHEEFVGLKFHSVLVP
jgi:hypothetical protein